VTKLAERMSRITTSPTMALAAKAARLRRQGVDVVDFGAGEPDFPTPEHVKAAARAAIDANFTKYTVSAGIPDLRAAIAERYHQDYGVTFGEAETIVSAGGKQALFNAMLALFGPGDEVITHAPYWPTIPEQIKIADATPVIVRTHAEDGFRIRPEAVLDAITPRTRGIVINSPCNPTGALMTEDDMAVIADEAARRGLWIVLDLCYENLIYEDDPHNLPRILFDRMQDRTVLCGSTSKAYAMTGWRCGWTVGPEPVIHACNDIQGHSTSNACSITQRAAVAALAGPQECVWDMLVEYRRRRDLVWDLLTSSGRLQCLKPKGAFYLFLDATGVLDPEALRTSADLARALLDDAKVALTPGEGFDAPGFLRISYATSEDQLREGCARIAQFIEALDRGRVPVDARR
jgi:aspartate aminotransferase